MKLLLLACFLFCVHGSTYDDMSLILEVEHPQPGSPWTPHVYPRLALKALEDGPVLSTANEIRADPGAFKLCVDGGWDSPVCQWGGESVHEWDLSSGVAVSMPAVGNATLQAWVQRRSDPVGFPSALSATLCTVPLKVDEFYRWTHTVELCGHPDARAGSNGGGITLTAGTELPNTRSSVNGSSMHAASFLLAT